MAIKNRYEFMYYVACTDSNPNGDPDMGNTPRMDPQTMQGYISDVSTKRLIRNYVSMAREGEPGMEIIVQQSTNMNRQIARAKRESGVDDCAKTKEAVYRSRCTPGKPVNYFMMCVLLGLLCRQDQMRDR